MPSASDPDYPHLNKKKIVVLVVIGLVVLLLAALVMVDRPSPAPLRLPAPVSLTAVR